MADHKEKDRHAVDAMAREHLSDIDWKIADLKSLRREISDLIGQCKQGTTADCRILSALSPRKLQRQTINQRRI